MVREKVPFSLMHSFAVVLKKVSLTVITRGLKKEAVPINKMLL